MAKKIKKSTKKLVVTMPDGSKWAVPALFIAEQRARYYSQKSLRLSEHTEKQAFDHEVKYALDNEEELLDWAHNNMGWPDVKDTATKVSKPIPLDYDAMLEGWINGDKTIEP